MKERIEKFSGEYRFLSNFWPSPVDIEGVGYPTVEHAYQAMKTWNIEERLEISEEDTPGKAKRRGRKVELRSDWDDVKIDVMKRCLQLKFGILELREKLLDTGEIELIEGNVWGDVFWGVCNGVGKNWLGKLLMRIRRELRELEV